MGEISLLSLNTFGIPFYLGWERLGRLARVLNHSPVNLISLQEIQQNAYASLLQRTLTTFPHAAYERHRYAPKGGLATFSRIPWVEQRFQVFPERGSWFSISFADWALYKGIQSLTLEIDGLSIVVLNTHLNANYSGVWHMNNRLSRILYCQVRQLIRVIGSCSPEVLIVVCGDLNFPRDSWLYQELVDKNNLVDPLASDTRPSYRPFPLVPGKWKTSLDYVLIRPPYGLELQVDADILPIEDVSKKSRLERFLSDHNALTLEISWGVPDARNFEKQRTIDRIE